MKVDGLLRRDSEVGKGPFLLVEHFYLVRRFTVWLEEMDMNI